MSLKSAYVKYKNTWYESKNGVPTGGKTSVDIANITVFFVFSKLLYDPQKLPKELVHFMRFVDDGNGLWNGSRQSLISWFNGFREASFHLYNLDMTYEVTNINEFSQFLDVKYELGNDVLKTDLFREQTNADRYSNFPRHPPHYALCNIV